MTNARAPRPQEARVFDKPRIVTEADLIESLAPYIASYPWALDTIGDLFRLGAPDPNQVVFPGYQERRVLMPGQFAKWWADVAARASSNLTPREVIR